MTGRVLCARWLFCEALALVAVVVCVELVVQVVSKSDFCTGCGFASMQGRGWYQGGFWVEDSLTWCKEDLVLQPLRAETDEQPSGASPTLWCTRNTAEHFYWNWKPTPAPMKCSSPSHTAGRPGEKVEVGWVSGRFGVSVSPLFALVEACYERVLCVCACACLSSCSHGLPGCTDCYGLSGCL